MFRMLMPKTLPGTIVAYLAGLILAVYWVLAGAQRIWSVTIPDVVHTYGIRNRRGVDLYFRPAVGWFIENGFWVFLGAAVAAVLVEAVVRATSKPSQPSTTDGVNSLR